MADAIRTGELATRVGARLRGDPDRPIRGAATLVEAGPEQVAFYANPRYRQALRQTRAGAVLLDEAAARDLAGHSAVLLVCDRPNVAFAKALEIFHPRTLPPPGVHPTAVVDPSARVDPSATIGALAYVGPGAEIGAGSVLWPQAHVGAGARVGCQCELHPHSVLLDRCVLGDRVVLYAGAVVGSDGFGYALEQAETGPRHRKIPQVGTVTIEDDVEIGAGSCIDRATTGETRIGRGSKIDNLVQVGHNCVVGPLSILCGQVGLAGSTTLGTGVVLAGGAGLAGHLHVGDGARVGAASGVMNDIPGGETWSGTPALPHTAWLRMMAAMRRLPEILRRLRALETTLGAGRHEPSEGSQ